ncbi:SpoIIE family protein phosphatase [Actinoallomurus bryophytorum]|uniref:GAF domain-containing protein n=1 Tax=Actinoallomurus bryophytorum TaxID=1490222 RepID=A0A543BZC0_9ACTN|nr:GAF domain-containing SpoIIE family protein phosphatase [Actinoallomurus bryophytorum]TQL90171.1 GAF domain-containing protein [Actinoallomurus bryophytorum]
MTTPTDLSATAEVRLQQIQAITDAALSHLDDEGLLGELLERVREILQVDTAVVLLLDDSGRRLVAVAARGIEEEVRQSVQVPVGRGFAGRVAAERRPVIIEDIDSADVVNPLLVQRGIRSLLGTPLLIGGDLLGVLHVGTFTGRRFTPDEVEFLRLAADRAAMAARSLRAGSERAAVRELQRSLVPAALPVIPGIEMAARYSPGTAIVGGDWYDVFTLPSGELGVVMGDVAGQGLRAAVIMGRMRSALRAYALEFDDPAEVLDKLDRKMQHFEGGIMATVLYAVCDPELESARIASAGHWPPVLAAPGCAATLLEIDQGILIGVDEVPRRRSTRVPIPPGSVLCFYTDGLIERRDTTVETNLARLCESVVPGPPDTVCASVMAALVGRETVRDDIALLTLRRMP